MINKIGLLIILITGFFLSSCSDTYFPEPDSEDGWRTNKDPEFVKSLGLNPRDVNNFLAYNLLTEGSTSAIVIKDGWVVGEWYEKKKFRDKKIYVASIGKSFALACFGIAVKDGAEGKLPIKVAGSSKLYDRRWLEDGFPLSDPKKQKITFDHVFRHTAGFAPEELVDTAGRNLWSDYIPWVVGHDPQWPQIGKLVYSPGRLEEYTNPEHPGEQKNLYSSIGFAHIGPVLSQLYGMPVEKFLWNRLLKPIGFSGVEYYNPPSPPEIKWFSGGGLEITTRDLARFAYFMMHNGNWDGKTILPENWVQSLVTTPNYPNLRSNVDSYFGERYPKDMYRMFGSGGNFVFVVPSLDLIFIRTGHIRNYFLKTLERDFLRRAFNMFPAYKTN